MLDILTASRDRIQSRTESPRLNATLYLAAGISFLGVLMFAASLAAAALGADRGHARYAATIAQLVLGVGYLIAVGVFLVHLLKLVRRSHFWKTETSLLADDFALIERLASNPLADLETLKRMSFLRRDIFRNRHDFGLGQAAKTSPWLVLLFAFLILSHDGGPKLAEQILPGSAQLLTNVSNWVIAGVLVVGFAFVRIRWLEIDESYSRFICLTECAHARATGNKGLAMVASTSPDPNPETTNATAENGLGPRAARVEGPESDVVAPSGKASIAGCGNVPISGNQVERRDDAATIAKRQGDGVGF